MRKLQGACVRVNSEAFDAIRILAGHEQISATRFEREISGVRIGRERVPAREGKLTVVLSDSEHSDALVDTADVVIVRCVRRQAAFGAPKVSLAKIFRVITSLEVVRIALYGLYRRQPLLVIHGAYGDGAVELAIHVSHAQ